MPWDRKRLLGYVETIRLILAVTDKLIFIGYSNLHVNAVIKKTVINFYILVWNSLWRWVVKF